MIRRNIASAANDAFDLIVVGGGVYGVALTLEAARRQLRPLLLERADYGGETSWNSLRIVHGGLRYLQSLDVRRHRESVRERQWLLSEFPDLVKPLSCLMPLYGDGLRRPAIVKGAMIVDALLSRIAASDAVGSARLPRARILSARETVARFPAARAAGLKGGALWYDAVMPDSQRIIIEMLHWASACGAVVANYAEADGLLRSRDRVAGVAVIDLLSGGGFEARAPIVVNCAGPWCEEVARRFDRAMPDIFPPSLAFNVLLDRQPIADDAVAVAPGYPGARTYFVHKCKGKMLAGTYHAPWSGPPRKDCVNTAMLDRFLSDLNLAIPDLDLTARDVLRVHAGLLPARHRNASELAARERIRHHADTGGPKGLYTVAGVKYTMARAVAEKTLRRMARVDRKPLPPLSDIRRPAAAHWYDAGDYRALLERDEQAAAEHVRSITNDESVVHLDDLILRRTDWGMDPAVGKDIAARVVQLMNWEPEKAVMGQSETTPVSR